MVGFLDKLRSARQLKPANHGPVAGWNTPVSFKDYMSKVGRLQDGVRKEMGNWLEHLNSDSEGLHSELQTQVDIVKRKLGTTLNGLETKLQNAICAAKDKLGAQPEMDDLAMFGQGRRNDGLATMGTTNREAEGNVDAEQPQQEPSQEAMPKAPGAGDRLRVETPYVIGAASGEAVRPLMRTEAPAAPDTSSRRPEPSHMQSTFRIAESHPAGIRTGNGNTTDVPSAMTPPRKQGIAALKSASLRIGRAIQTEEFAGGQPRLVVESSLSFPATSYNALTVEEREREAQRLADWLAAR